MNVHFHTLVLDGIFSEARPGQLTFHPVPPPSDEDVRHVLATVRARVGQLLARRYVEPADDTAPGTRSPKSRPSWPASWSWGPSRSRARPLPRTSSPAGVAPRRRRRRPRVLADAVANRDFIRLVILLACFGKAHSFLFPVALGTPIFMMLVRWGAGRRRTA